MPCAKRCPGVAGIAIFDKLPNPATELSTLQGLQEYMWQRREIENYLVTRESLLASVRGDLRDDDLLERGELVNRTQVLEQCITALESSLKIGRRPDPWGADIKVTDEFLDPLFANFYEQLGTPQQTFKRDYHQLADAIPLDQIPQEVTHVLDLIAETAAKAVPVT